MGVICKANPSGNGVNYNKPHVAVYGVYNGEARLSCIYCGRWLGEAVESSFVGHLKSVDTLPK